MNKKIEKLEMKSADGAAAGVARLAALFPEAVTEVVRDGRTERRIDFDALRLQ